MQFRIRCFLFIGLFSWGLIGQTLPKGFVFLNEQIPDLEVSLRYATTDNFTGRIVGASTNILNQAALDSGTYVFGVLGHGNETSITLKSSSHFPCTFQSAEWEGFFVLRSRRL